MGMFDTIYAEGTCPFCKAVGVFEAQTKDLNKMLYEYSSLPSDWFTSPLERKFRKGLAVFPAFPYDKSHKVWKNQAERREARAKLEPGFKDKKFVEVICSCDSLRCKNKKFFYGRIRIKGGMFIGKIYGVSENRKCTLRHSNAEHASGHSRGPSKAER